MSGTVETQEYTALQAEYRALLSVKNDLLEALEDIAANSHDDNAVRISRAALKKAKP